VASFTWWVRGGVVDGTWLEDFEGTSKCERVCGGSVDFASIEFVAQPARATETRTRYDFSGDIGTRGAMEVLDLLAMSIFMWLSIATQLNLRFFTIIQDLWTSEQCCLP
jgi:hypothetical protein